MNFALIRIEPGERFYHVSLASESEETPDGFLSVEVCVAIPTSWAAHRSLDDLFAEAQRRWKEALIAPPC